MICYSVVRLSYGCIISLSSKISTHPQIPNSGLTQWGFSRVAAHCQRVAQAQAHGPRSSGKRKDCRRSPRKRPMNGGRRGSSHDLTAKATRASGTNNGTRRWRAARNEAETRGQIMNARRRCWHSSSVPRLCARHGPRRRRLCYFFFVLVLLLLAVFGLAARLVVLPDPHPHRLHAILHPFTRASIFVGRSTDILSAAWPGTL